MKDNDNLTIERPTFVTHLECAMEGDHNPADQIHNLSKANKPLLVRYDLAGVKKALTKEALAQRPADMWRYREMLPVRKVSDIVSLGEVMTPLIRLPKLGKKAGGAEIIVKDEGRLPTGSFKARGLVMAVSMGKALGIKHMAMPTNGNAGAALAAYATSCGIKTTIFCPADTPEVNVSEIELQGATVYRVNGLIDDCGKIVGEGKAKAGWFDTSTLKEPYRIEGKKTMGLELAEQLGWEVPDVIFYPTGGGTGLIGMWKAFAELEAIGFIGAKRPRMVAVQASGCAPMVRAFEARRAFHPIEDAILPPRDGTATARADSVEHHEVADSDRDAQPTRDRLRALEEVGESRPSLEGSHDGRAAGGLTTDEARQFRVRRDPAQLA